MLRKPRSRHARPVGSGKITSGSASGRISVAPGQIAAGAAYCPAGTWVVSGGANQVSGSGLMRITDSYPEAEGWRVVYANEGPDTASAYVGVGCGN